MLTKSAQNKLEKLLDALDAPEDNLNILELQGFLFAVVITPDVLQPSEWMAEIFDGEMPEYDSMEQAQEITECIMGAYNHFNELRNKGRLKFPFKIEKFNADVFDEMIDWSYGFLTGLRLRTDIWLSNTVADEMGVENDPVTNSVGIVLAVADDEFDKTDMLKNLAERCSEEELTEKELEIKLFSELLLTLPIAIKTIQEFADVMEERRLTEIVSEQRPGQRANTRKIGRNEPCPCGSGKKYKKCCALNRQEGHLH